MKNDDFGQANIRECRASRNGNGNGEADGDAVASGEHRSLDAISSRQLATGN